MHLSTGLGKTVELLALICANRWRPDTEVNDPDGEGGGGGGGAAGGGGGADGAAADCGGALADALNHNSAVGGAAGAAAQSAAEGEAGEGAPQAGSEPKGFAQRVCTCGGVFVEGECPLLRGRLRRKPSAAAAAGGNGVQDQDLEGEAGGAERLGAKRAAPQARASQQRKRPPMKRAGGDDDDDEDWSERGVGRTTGSRRGAAGRRKAPSGGRSAQRRRGAPSDDEDFASDDEDEQSDDDEDYAAGSRRRGGSGGASAKRKRGGGAAAGGFTPRWSRHADQGVRWAAAPDDEAALAALRPTEDSPWVECRGCAGMQHAVCAGVTKPDFVCRGCVRPAPSIPLRCVAPASLVYAHSRLPRSLQFALPFISHSTHNTPSPFTSTFAPRCRRKMAIAEVPTPCGSTLIVCPAPILDQWHAELKKHIKCDLFF